MIFLELQIITQKSIFENNSYFNSYIRRGIIFYKQNKAEQAIFDFSYVLKNKNDAVCFYNRGNVYYDLGSYRKAIDDYWAAISLNNNDSDAYTMLGNCYIQIKDYDKAKSCYKKALQINPSDKQAKQNLNYLEQHLLFNFF